MSKSLHDKLNYAVMHQRIGNFPEAEGVYREILREDPNHAESLNNLGVLALKVGKAPLGLPYLKKAVELYPNFIPFTVGYATSLLRSGRGGDARDLIDRAVSAGSSDRELYSLREQCTHRETAIAAASGDIISVLSPHVAGSAGSPTALATLALQDAGQLAALLALVSRLRVGSIAADQMMLAPQVKTTDSMTSGSTRMMQLKDLFDRYGSDKASSHDYHIVYEHVLPDSEAVTAILEIGLGSNNSDVVSSMAASYCPGASLRAFRDLLPNARIYGADIDRSILFSEERIRTFYVDQTDQVALGALAAELGAERFDLIIDDGLHSPSANVATMLFALPLLKEGGWFIVEDITSTALSVWEVVSALLPENMASSIIRARGGYMFAVQILPPPKSS